MPAMSAIERIWCQSRPWKALTGGFVLPWALRGAELHGRALEIGAGSGANAEALLRRNPQLELTATDVDPRMVGEARRRLEPFGGRVTVLEADSTALPFDDAHFDAVVSLIMLHHVIDWEDALAEVHRVLRPGGSLVGYDMVRSRAGRLVHVVDRSPHRLMSVGELRRQLARLGFVEVEVRPAVAGQIVRFRAWRSAGLTASC
jgi:ubiquinone/menaquinone biosynthesis C-methylase UbiE